MSFRSMMAVAVGLVLMVGIVLASYGQPPKTKPRKKRLEIVAPIAFTDEGNKQWAADHYEHHTAAVDKRRRSAVDRQHSRIQSRSRSRLSSETIPPGDVWERLAQCESGGDQAKNTGNGYYGAFQFSLSTWRGIGGTGYPHDHSYAVQRDFAIRLQARSGWGQWPTCSRQLGLR